MAMSGILEWCDVPHPARRGVQRHPVGGVIDIAILSNVINNQGFTKVIGSTGDDEGVTPADEAGVPILKIELRYDNDRRKTHQVLYFRDQDCLLTAPLVLMASTEISIVSYLQEFGRHVNSEPIR